MSVGEAPAAPGRFTLDGGRVREARWCPSPNADERPPGQLPELIVLHGISLPPGRFATGHVHDLFCNVLDPTAHEYFADLHGLRVSAHFLIERSGQLTQFVDCGRRAWHAGRSTYRGRSACNDFSIGIELEGTDDLPYSESQYSCLMPLLRALLASYPSLSRDAIAGHCDIAPGRKTDPGPAFDWERLRRTLSPGPV